MSQYSSLKECWDRHEGRFTLKLAHYPLVYDRFFRKFMDQPVVVLEFGAAQGGSLQVWRDFLGAQAMVYGVDASRKSEFTEPQIEVLVGDYMHPPFLKKLMNSLPPPDIIIDDGNHQPDIQKHLFGQVFPWLKDGGVYICEDLFHNTLEQWYETSLMKSLFETCRKMCPPDWHTSDDTLPFAIHFYRQVLVVEKLSGVDHSVVGKGTFVNQ